MTALASTFRFPRCSLSEVAALFLLSVSLVTPISGQALQGRLLELKTGIPIPGGSVALIDENGRAVVSTLSDSSGLFLLQAPSPGEYSVSAEAFGYLPTVDGPLELIDGQESQALFHLQMVPMILDSVQVMVEPRNRQLEIFGFYERKKNTAGFFVEREEIEKRNPRHLTDLFRARSGFRVVPVQSGSGYTIVSRRFVTFQKAESSCVPAIYLDGFRVGDPGVTILDDVVDPENVEAIEAYAGATRIPAQWLDSHSACGVVVIWTRRGIRSAA